MTRTQIMIHSWGNQNKHLDPVLQTDLTRRIVPFVSRVGRPCKLLAKPVDLSKYRQIMKRKTLRKAIPGIILDCIGIFPSCMSK